MRVDYVIYIHMNKINVYILSDMQQDLEYIGSTCILSDTGLYAIGGLKTICKMIG